MELNTGEETFLYLFDDDAAKLATCSECGARVRDDRWLIGPHAYSEVLDDRLCEALYACASCHAVLRAPASFIGQRRAFQRVLDGPRVERLLARARTDSSSGAFRDLIRRMTPSLRRIALRIPEVAAQALPLYAGRLELSVDAWVRCGSAATVGAPEYLHPVDELSWSVYRAPGSGEVPGTLLDTRGDIAAVLLPASTVLKVSEQRDGAVEVVLPTLFAALADVAPRDALATLDMLSV